MLIRHVILVTTSDIILWLHLHSYTLGCRYFVHFTYLCLRMPAYNTYTQFCMKITGHHPLYCRTSDVYRDNPSDKLFDIFFRNYFRFIIYYFIVQILFTEINLSNLKLFSVINQFIIDNNIIIYIF